MTDDLPSEETTHSGDTGNSVPHDLNIPDYAMNYFKALHSYFPEIIPDAEFWNSDDAARHFAELVTNMLNTKASPSDHARLANHLYAAKSSEGAQQAADRIANETPFASVAHKISEVNHKHGPGWGAWLAALLLPIVAPLSGVFGQSTSTMPPLHVAEPTHVVVLDKSNVGGTSTMSEHGPTPVVATSQTPASVTYRIGDSTYHIDGGLGDLAHSGAGLSVTITGPQYDVEVISNILRQFSPAAFNQLSPEQQQALAHSIFAEIGKMHSQQSVDFTAAQVRLNAASQHYGGFPQVGELANHKAHLPWLGSAPKLCYRLTGAP